MMDGKKLDEIHLPFLYRVAGKKALKQFEGTIVEELLERYHLI